MASLSSLRPSAPQGHPWTFFRAGGLDQVKLESADDLRNLGRLDQKLWVALSCPVKGLEFDQRTLELIDQDKDGRVRAPEVIAAVDWTIARLADPADLFAPRPALPLAAISGSDAGKAVLASARQVLENLGKANATEVSLAEVTDSARIFADTTFNGDGVVQPGCAKDDQVKAVIEEIIAITGGDPDRSGKTGVSKERAEGFFAELAAYDAWYSAGELGSRPGSDILPLLDRTPAAHATLAAVRNKIDDYFTRCALAAFDTRAGARLNRLESDYDAIAGKDLSHPGGEVENLPISQVAAGRALSLSQGLNPAWAARMASFREQVVTPLLGAVESLSEAQWRDLAARFTSFEAWQLGKKGASVEKLGIARVRAILASPARSAIGDLIAQDLAVGPQVSGIQDLERLVRYYLGLGILLKNFINFADFYDRQPPPPIFVVGTLYLDQRSCDLCIKVEGADPHSTLAMLGKCFIAYVKCSRPSGETMVVAAVFSQGDDDYLMVGRNGILYDRQGRDWDATILKIISNPISLGQAFWSPYKKFVRLIEEQVAKRAQAADAAANSNLEQAAANVANADKNAKDKKPEPKKFDVGTVAALGVALGAVGTIFTGIITGFIQLEWWQKPLALVGLVLAVSGPSVLIAWLKLRQRTLGPILEANGWAINGRVKINIPLGNSLTSTKKLPPGSRRLLDDPFEDKEAKRRTRQTIAALVVVALVAVGAFAGWEYLQMRRTAEAQAKAEEAIRARTDAEDRLAQIQLDLKRATDPAQVKALEDEALKVTTEIRKAHALATTAAVEANHRAPGSITVPALAH